MNMAQEPSRIISLVTAFITAVIGAAAAFGLNIDDTQRNAILAVVAPAVAVIIALGEVIRSRVVSPASAGEAVAIAKMTPSESNVVPDVRVGGYKQAVVDNMPLVENQGQINWKPRVEAAGD
jgi:hypothetical protein